VTELRESGSVAETLPPLRRNRRFQLLWSGSAFSVLGLELADLVFPLVVLAVSGSPAMAGVAGSVQMVTALLLGLPAGELTDRFDRRKLLLTVECVRALAIGSLVPALALGRPSLAQLLIVSVVLGAMRPIAATTRMLLIRALVPAAQLTAALTQEEVRTNGAALTGPPLGGALYAVGPAIPFLTTTGTLIVSAVCVSLVGHAGAEPPPRPVPGAGPAPGGPSALRRMTAGLGAIRDAPALRRTTLFTAAMNAATAPLVLITVVHLERQGVGAGPIGLATAGLAAGGLAGASLVRPLHRLSPGTLMLGQAGSVAVLICLLGLPLGAWGAAAVLFLLMLAVPAMRVLVDVVMFRQVVDEQRGRVASAAMTLWGLGSATGTLVAGLLLDATSAAVTVVVIAAGLLLVLVAGLSSRSFRRTAWPVG
jgi:MFS family permease